MYFLVLSGSAVVGYPGAAMAQQGENVRFWWTFGAMVGPMNAQKLVPITRDTTLKSGAKLQMFIQLQTRCFVYVIYRSQRDEVYLLFPYEIKQFDTLEYTTGKKYYIPRDYPWFVLDEHVGRETFYLLASAQRLHNLERLIGSYTAAAPASQPALAQQVVAEIRELRRSRLVTTAVRPVSIGCNVRLEVIRLPLADQFPVLEIAATDFYGKAFTIDHQ